MSETHWKKLSDPNYLGSWDFQKGEERTLTISRVVQEEVVDMEKVKKDAKAKKSCIVAYFRENSKPMILNKTNCKTIQELYKTPIIEKWAGCAITIKVEKVRAFGKMEEALRVKSKDAEPESEPEQAPQPVPPSIPFCHDCNNEITALGKYTAEQIAAVNQKRYGVPLCAECSNKRKSEEVKADAVDE